jgi:hypothetical protein
VVRLVPGQAVAEEILLPARVPATPPHPWATAMDVAVVAIAATVTGIVAALVRTTAGRIGIDRM